MRIERLILGTVEGDGPVARTYALRPGLSVIVVDDPEGTAAAVRDTLTRPERDAAGVPFVSVEIQHDDIALTVADDAASGLRMMTRGRAGAIPEVLEIHRSDPEEVIDGGLDAIFSAVAAAAGVEDIEDVAPALAVVESDGVVNDVSPEARRFLESTRRASELAAAVRGVDDRMTASVVPDWLWIATGVGGLGVFCTAIAFLYPELRVVLVAVLVVLSVVGFSLYGWRAAQEMKTRARLQEERAKLRARREDARAEAKTYRDALAASGQDPDALLVALGALPRTAPAILGEAAPDLAHLAECGRQVLVFSAVAPADRAHLVRPSEA